MSGSSDQAPRRSPGIVFRRIDDEAVFVPIRDKVGDLRCIFTSNDVGGRIWELMDGLRSCEDMAALIADEYRVGEAQALEDVEHFVSQLVASGCANLNKDQGQASTGGQSAELS